MITQKDFIAALRFVMSRDGQSQAEYAASRGLTQPQISDYLRGRFSVSNMTLCKLNRLFPDMEISLFREPAGATTPPSSDPSDKISRNDLEIQILESHSLTPEERNKFLLFLKKEVH